MLVSHCNLCERPSNGETPDYTNGIFQSIGFKEFHQYLTSGEEDSEEKKKQLYEKGVEQLQLVTRQYARKQIKWMRQRFLHFHRSCPDVYKLDSTKYPDNWNEDVYHPAVAIVQAFIEGVKPLHRPMECDAKSTYSHEETRMIFSCDTCSIDLKGKIQLEAHLKSKRHAWKVKHLKKTSQLLHMYQNKIEANLKS
jgi:tRNA dimethylallyltransferase